MLKSIYVLVKIHIWILKSDEGHLDKTVNALKQQVFLGLFLNQKKKREYIYQFNFYLLRNKKFENSKIRLFSNFFSVPLFSKI